MFFLFLIKSQNVLLQKWIAAFCDDCLVKKGVVCSRGLKTIAAILDIPKVEVTVEALQPNYKLK